MVTPPTVSAGTAATICEGESAPLTTTVTGGTAPYTLCMDSFCIFECSATAANPTAVPTGTTTYTVVVTDASAFSASLP